jgi:sugar lactone lactonase YvrE
VADSNNFRVRLIRLNPCSPTVCGPQISTFAGNGTPSWSGDGGQATSAQLGNPYAIAFDAAGNEYIADNQNAAIRKITPSGVISTIAGTGVSGYSGDGGPAVGAKLNDPRGVAVNAAGDIFISDAANQRIRKVDHSTGNITTVVGDGFIGSFGDGGLGTGAEVNFPTGLAVDAGGNLYIADTGNNRVRVLAPGGTITAFAGDGIAGFGGDGTLATSAQLHGPEGLALDASGNLAIADTLNNRVRRVDGTGTITTIAGTGQFGLAGDLHLAILAMLAKPYGVAFDSTGNLYIADTFNERVRAIDTHGIIRSVVGSCGIVAAFSGDGGPADLAHVNFPLGLATDGFNNLYIAEIDSNRVRIASIPQGSRGDTCPAAAGSAGTRGVTGSGGGTPGTRMPQSGPASRIPMPLNLPAGTTVPSHPTRALPARIPARLIPPGRQAPGAARPSNVQAVPEVVGAPKLAMAVRPTNAPDPISPWYALLLAPFALLVVALVIQWRRQRE